jgi:hypothetical protein
VCDQQVQRRLVPPLGAVRLGLALPLPRTFGGVFLESPPQGAVVAIAVALIIAVVSLLET